MLVFTKSLSQLQSSSQIDVLNMLGSAAAVDGNGLNRDLVGPVGIMHSPC